jgi:hypothetical protein
MKASTTEPTDLDPPPLHVSRWFNAREPISLQALRGRVVAIHTFQMLCPACVAHGLPQASRLRETFAQDQLAVIGLHTVFEHHDAMGPNALEAFIHEYRLRFPIGVDEPDPNGPVPKTMAAWGLQGTPSLVLLDRRGQVQWSHFGTIDDMALGALVGRLLGPLPAAEATPAAPRTEPAGCNADACDLGDR